MITRICKQKQDTHNNLVMRIKDAGFDVPEPNEITGLMVGHIYPTEMK